MGSLEKASLSGGGMFWGTATARGYNSLPGPSVGATASRGGHNQAAYTATSAAAVRVDEVSDPLTAEPWTGSSSWGAGLAHGSLVQDSNPNESWRLFLHGARTAGPVLDLSSVWLSDYSANSTSVFSAANSTLGDGATDPASNLWKDIPLGVLLAVLTILTFLGNALVLHAVRTERRLQTVCIQF